jgi:hypothetical protein
MAGLVMRTKRSLSGRMSTWYCADTWSLFREGHQTLLILADYLAPPQRTGTTVYTVPGTYWARTAEHKKIISAHRRKRTVCSIVPAKGVFTNPTGPYRTVQYCSLGLLPHFLSYCSR